MKKANQYFNSKKHDVLENKSMIHVFKHSFWFKHLKWWKGFSKEFYIWKEDGDYFIIIEKKNKTQDLTRKD